MFGKHLIARGLLTEQQLLQALEQQGSLRPSIGRLAFERGFLDLDQVVAVIDAQAKSELRFCALAVEMRFLTTPQREALLAAQAEARLPLGQVLAMMGVVPADTLEEELDAYNDAKQAAAEES